MPRILERLAAAITGHRRRTSSPSLSQAGRVLAAQAEAKRRAIRSAHVRAHCAAVLASIPNRSESRP